MSQAAHARPKPDLLPLQKNWVEWIVFAASLAVIAVIVGFLVHAALTLEDAPPRIEVFLGEARKERDLYVVPVVVENQGVRAAAGIRVEVLLTRNGSVQRAGFDLSYSPGKSLRRGMVSFTDDPRDGTLEARVQGFELP